MQDDRLTEWFVPKFGSKNFRIGMGILFLPYTLMVVSFAAWGSFVGEFVLERLAAICLLYFLAIGISAHCLDAIGSAVKPWGNLPKKRLWIISIVSLSIAFSLGMYYAFLDSPLLFIIGILEGFFLFSYNLELFKGVFHNNATFVVSWGILPVFAGAAIQTNSISIEVVIASGIAGAISYGLIKTSRKYKECKKRNPDNIICHKKEIVLKIISLSVIAGTVIVFIKTSLIG